jgi:hypothetical protein
MMISNPTDEFRATAQRLTHVKIDGKDVDTREIEVNLDAAGNLHSFEMAISRVALHHELQQAGLAIDASAIESFVSADIRDHPSEALSGYLRITQGIHASPQPKSLFRLFSRRPTEAVKRWRLKVVDQVIVSSDAVVFRGVAAEV